MDMVSSNLLLLCNVNFIKPWICAILMEIGYYSNKRKNQEINSEGLIWTWNSLLTLLTPAEARLLAIYKFQKSIWPTIVTFIVLKVCQSRATIHRFCQDEEFELTYYIETLQKVMLDQNSVVIRNYQLILSNYLKINLVVLSDVDIHDFFVRGKISCQKGQSFQLVWQQSNGFGLVVQRPLPFLRTSLCNSILRSVHL